jgi:hypothetical protein
MHRKVFRFISIVFLCLAIFHLVLSVFADPAAPNYWIALWLEESFVRTSAEQAYVFLGISFVSTIIQLL